MNLLVYRKLKYKKYSPKDVLAYLIRSSKKTNEYQFEILLNSFEQELFDNVDKDKVWIESDDIEIYKKIKNSWYLSLNQVLSYAYIVYEFLLFEKKSICENEILNMYIYVMEQFSPDNAEAFVNSKFEDKTKTGYLY